MKASFNIIVEIVKYNPTQDFFKKHIYLCKRINQDIHLKRYMCKRHLGIVEDTDLEFMYCPTQTESNYQTYEQIGQYLNTFTRKAAYKLFLLGFQAIGGEEQLIDEQKLIDRGITHLFMDSAGTFHSNNLESVLTGIFFYEFDWDNADRQDILRELQKVTDLCNQQEILQKIIQKESITSDAVQKLIINEARHIDFRLLRALNDGRKDKSIKTWNNKFIISAVYRSLIANSAKRLTPESISDKIVQFDIGIQEKLAKSYLFCFNKIHVATKGLWTCPMRAFYVLCHNQPIQDIANHPLVLLIKQAKTLEQACDLQSPYIPKAQIIDFQNISSLQEVKLVEYNHDFYFEIFRDQTKAINQQQFYSLRLCAYIDLGLTTNKANIPFSQQFSARFVTIVPVQINDERHLSPQVLHEELNVDIQTIYFEGHRVPSLYYQPNNIDVEMIETN